jgi:hypothetical protein
MALTQTDLDALDLAIASSELEVQLEGRRVKYRSTDELLKARAHVAELVSTAQRRSSFRFSFDTQRGG